MARLMEVLGRVFVLGRVATSDMSAGEAQSQVNPCVPSQNAFLADMFVGGPYFDLIKVSAFFRHRFFPSL
jgi:hypothetical protein